MVSFVCIFYSRVKPQMLLWLGRGQVSEWVSARCRRAKLYANAQTINDWLLFNTTGKKFGLYVSIDAIEVRIKSRVLRIYFQRNPYANVRVTLRKSFVRRLRKVQNASATWLRDFTQRKTHHRKLERRSTSSIYSTYIYMLSTQRHPTYVGIQILQRIIRTENVHKIPSEPLCDARAFLMCVVAQPNILRSHWPQTFVFVAVDRSNVFDFKLRESELFAQTVVASKTNRATSSCITCILPIASNVWRLRYLTISLGHELC